MEFTRACRSSHLASLKLVFSLRYPEFWISRIILLFLSSYRPIRTWHHDCLDYAPPTIVEKKDFFSQNPPTWWFASIYASDLPCTAFSQALPVNSFDLRSDHVTRNAFAGRNNEASGPGKPRITTPLLCSSTCKPYVLVCLICISKPGIIFRDILSLFFEILFLSLSLEIAQRTSLPRNSWYIGVLNECAIKWNLQILISLNYC